jgi:predicted  nucleic acid-binding Zn-ribbon protein
MEEAIVVADEKLSKNEEVILDLRNRLASRERERQKDTSISSRGSAGNVYTAAEYEALEHELDEANREKAKWRALLDQSPARKAIEKAKDLKIELLEREKEELLERNKALRMTVNEIGTPNKLTNMSGISPIHRHVLNMSIRMPKTPGTPLRDVGLIYHL